MVDESRELQDGPNKVLLLVIAAVLVALSIALALRFQPSADALYCLAMVNDLLFGKTAFQWMSPGANYLVPDTLIVLLGRILGLDGQSNFVFFTVIYVALLFFSLSVLLRACNLSWNASLIGALIVTIIFGFSGSNAANVIAFPGIHQGVLPFIAVSFAFIAALTDRVWSNGWASVRLGALIALSGLIAVAVASDGITYVQLVVPAIAAVVAIPWRYHEPKARILLIICLDVGIVLAGALLGYLLWKLVNASGMIHQPTLRDIMNTARILAALKIFVSSFLLTPGSTGQTQFWFLIAGEFLASTVIFVIMTIPSARFRQLALRVGIDTPGRILCLAAIADCTVLSLAGPILAGTYVGLPILRQQQPALLFGPLLVIWLALSQLERIGGAVEKRKNFRIVIIGALSALLLLIPLARTTYAEIEDGMFPQPYLAVYKRLAQQLQHDGLNFVLAGYWDTKPLIEASGWTLDVCPTISNLAVYSWIMNIEWCSKLYRDWSKQKAPLVVFLKTSAERDSFFKENGMPVKVLELRNVESSEAAVYDWSPALDRAFKGNVCDAYTYKRMPKPSLCEER